jgi:hypothetical protein
MRPERAKFNSVRGSTFAEFAVLFPFSRENEKEAGPASALTQGYLAQDLSQRMCPKIGTCGNQTEDSMNKLTVTAGSRICGGSRMVAGAATHARLSCVNR